MGRETGKGGEEGGRGEGKRDEQEGRKGEREEQGGLNTCLEGADDARARRCVFKNSKK